MGVGKARQGTGNISGMTRSMRSRGRLEKLHDGKLAACRYDLAISKKSFLFLRTPVFAAYGRRAIMEV
jgi:hypothetical protein